MMRTLLRAVSGLLAAACLCACGVADSAQPRTVAPRAAVAGSATPAGDDADCRLATKASGAGAGCPSAADSDHDGVPDNVDACPDTTPGVAVDASGCAITSGG
jgi:hypothetical protein